MSVNVGRIGVWNRGPAWSEHTAGERAEAIAELEELGYGAVWLGLSPGDLELPEELLGATRRIVVATGIINIWTAPAEVVTAAYNRVPAERRERLLIGLGSSHAPLVGDAYKRPLSRLRGYLDELDAESSPVPATNLVLAALGPKALALAAERTAGAHPYLVTPEYTGIARETLGPDALLAVEQKVVLESEPVRARELARARVGPYMAMPNYTNNLLRLGFGDADFADGGSDRVLEALVASGEQAIRERVHAHLQAGADHVCLQVLDGDLPREQWRRLAPVLIDA